MSVSIPSSVSTVDVKLFNTAPTSTRFPADWFMTPILPGRENFPAPFFCFLIEHPHLTTGKIERLMFDLGARKDLENLAPSISSMLAEGASIEIEKDIVDFLIAGDIPLGSIDAVIWSHTHFDHIGDVSKFPSTTELVIGEGTDRVAYPENPDAITQESDFRGRKVTEINFSDSSLSIGEFSAVDYFGDGSLYLLSVPGHIKGHMAALARVTPTSFLLLGGDTCHHAGVLRPTTQLHLHIPCPGELLAATRKSISTAYFPSSSSPSSSNSDSQDFDLTARSSPLLDIPDDKVYADPVESRLSIKKLAAFDADPNIMVIIAHDESLVGILDYFPAKLNDWRERGLKVTGTWAFVDENNGAFRFSPA